MSAANARSMLAIRTGYDGLPGSPLLAGSPFHSLMISCNASMVSLARRMVRNMLTIPLQAIPIAAAVTTKSPTMVYATLISLVAAARAVIAETGNTYVLSR